MWHLPTRHCTQSVSDMDCQKLRTAAIGPDTNFFDPNVQLLNQANAMVEAGRIEGFILAT